MLPLLLLLFAAAAQEPGDNGPPELASLTIAPDTPRVTDTLTCTAGAVSDPDGDAVEVVYGWTVNGEAIDATEAKLPAKGLSRGDEVACVGTPSDGAADGEAVTSATVVIANDPPVLPSAAIEPAAPLGGQSLTCEPGKARDGDGDDVTFRYGWTVDGEDAGVSASTLDGVDKGSTVACVVTPFDGVDLGKEVTSAEVALGNNPPVVAAPSLGPNDANVASTLACTPGEASDPDGDDLVATIAWTVGGEPVSGATGDTLAAPAFAKRDAVRCTVTVTDGEAEASAQSEPLEVRDAAPAVLGVTVVPEAPSTRDDLSCKVTQTEDPDGDPVKLAFLWTINGADAGVQSAVLRASVTRRDAAVACTAIPSADHQRGEPATSEAVVIANTPPTLDGAALVPDAPRVTDTLACQPGATADADGDTVRLERRWEVSGAAVRGGETLSAPAFGKGDAVQCFLTPTDGTDAGAEVASAPVTVRNTPPSVRTVRIDPGAPVITEDLVCRYAVAPDPDGDEVTVGLAWTVDGEAAGEGESLATGYRKGQSVAVVATPNDGAEPGEPLASEPVEIRNSVPVVAAVSLGPEDVRTDGTLTAEAAATDADGDPVDLVWSWSVNGKTVDHDDGSLGGDAFGRGDRVKATVTPHDGEAAGEPITTHQVTVQNSAPTAPWVLVDDPRGGVVDLVCRLAEPAVDPDEDTLSYRFDWTADGEPFTGTRTTELRGDTVPQSALRMDQDWTCIATARDDALEGPPSEPSTVTVIAPHVGAGSSHACALDTAGDVTCWGNRDHGMDEPPPGKMRQLSVGGWHACAVQARDRSAVCWGHDVYRQLHPPAVEFDIVSAGGWHTCGLDVDGKIWCWGQDADGRIDPPEGNFVDLSAGWKHTCAIDEAGVVTCWGDDSVGQASPPPGGFTQVSAGEYDTCALSEGGDVVCWGSDRSGALAAPGGPFVQVAVGSRFGCALREDATVSCWGADSFGQLEPPTDRFRLLGKGVNSMCGWTADDRLECWGQDNYGQARPPP